MQAKSAAGLLRVAAGLLGQVVGTARQIPLRGRQHLPHRAYRPLLKLFSELEIPARKGEGPQSFVVSKSRLGNGVLASYPEE